MTEKRINVGYACHDVENVSAEFLLSDAIQITIAAVATCAST